MRPLAPVLASFVVAALVAAFAVAPAGAKIVRRVGRDGILTYVYVPDRPKVRRTPARRIRRRYRTLLAEAARKYRLPEALLEAVLRTESNGNQRAVSGAGAQGLMQLIPRTQARMGVVDPFDPRESVFGGARYLRELGDRFDDNVLLMIAGYHAGARAVEAAGRRVPDFPSTRQYVTTVLRRYWQVQARRRLRSRGSATARKGGAP